MADAVAKVEETVAIIARALNVPPYRLRVPAWKAAWNVLRHPSPQDPQHTLTIDLFFPLWRSMRLNTDRIRRELGWRPRVDWREAVREAALAWKAEREAAASAGAARAG